MSDEQRNIYESAVRGRREFRAAYRAARVENQHLRDALDRIARFGEAYKTATEKLGHDGRHAGPALVITLGNYARDALNANCVPVRAPSPRTLDK
jgi:hypothetical protein